MKIFARLSIVISILITSHGTSFSQDCQHIDKFKLSRLMNIDKTLIPFLNLEIPDCSNLKVDQGLVGFVLGVENARLHGGIRSEISIDYPFNEGDVIDYRWSIMLPSPSSPGAGEKEWWLIAQWHDQPDPKFGETWATLKPQPPPVAIYVEKRNGVTGIGLQRLQGKKVTWIPVPENTWLSLSIKIRWSTTDDGYVVLNIEELPEFNFVSIGRNMLNSYQHYFKAGQYRSSAIRKYSEIYIKDIYFRKM